jgi:hypothetical protein
MSLTKATYAMIEGAPINVLDFGAVGDGVTDSLAAFQAAIAALPNGGVIYIPKGTYVTATFFDFTCNNITLEGDGDVTILKSTNTTTNNQHTLKLTGNDNTVRSLKIDGNSNALDPATVFFREGVSLIGSFGLIENVTTINTASSGVRLQGPSAVSLGKRLSAVNCRVQNAGNSFAANNSFGVIAAWATDIFVTGCHVDTTLRSGIFIFQASNVRVTNNYVTNAENGIRNADDLTNQQGFVVFSNNTVSNSTGDLIRFTGNNVSVVGNVCSGSTGGSGANSEGGVNQVVANNVFVNNAQNGIRIGGSVGSTARISITGNVCSGNTGNGIFLRGGDPTFTVSITDCTIQGNTLTGNNDKALRTQAAAVASTATIGSNIMTNEADITLEYTNWTYRNNDIRGANITAASTINIGGANIYAVSGTADITTIAGGMNDQEVTLLFAGNASGSGVVEGSNIRLTTANFAYVSSAVLKLVNFNGTWYEVSRALN